MQPRGACARITIFAARRARRFTLGDDAHAAISFVLAVAIIAAACNRESKPAPAASPGPAALSSDYGQMLAQYATVKLTTNTTVLRRTSAEMIPLLIEAAQEMNPPFWVETSGSRDSLMRHVQGADARKLVDINYGPWNRLGNNAAFISRSGPNPRARILPAGDDEGRVRFRRRHVEGARRFAQEPLHDDPPHCSGRLTAIPYSKFFAAEHGRAADKLLAAAKLADDPGFKKYLSMRANRCSTNDVPAERLRLDGHEG